MYNLTASTELIKNQKAAQVLADQSLFLVLQNSQGKSLFFSIGDTSILYLCAEQDNVTTGWTPIDLTTELAASYPGKTVTAKTFAASQDVATGNILILQVIHIAEDKADYLYILTGLSNAPDAAWLTSPANRHWVSRPASAAITISYINLSLNQNPALAPYVIAGVEDTSTSYIQNYIVNINPANTTDIWTRYQTAENYDQLYGMEIGKAKAAMFAGLYELYTLNDNVSLTFTPLKSLYSPPDIIKLTAPLGATAIATTPPDDNGNTNLYAAGNGAIYLYTPDQQTNFATGIAVITSTLISGVEYMKVHQSGNQVAIWGRNNAGSVFYSRCDVARQADSSAWSAPIPLLQGTDQLASMLDLQTQTSILYAHTTGQTVVRLVQDAVTTQWRSQSILLPMLSTSDIYQYYAFTTTLKVADENGLPISGQTLQVTATSPCTLYIDNLYITLLPDTSLSVTADSNGTITLVQETQTPGAVCYNVQQADNSWLNINPMNDAIQKMSGIQRGPDLTSVKITDEYGNTKSLVSTSIPTDQSDAVAQGIAQFVKTAQSLPQNGTLQPASATLTDSEGLVWGLSFDNNSISYFEGSSSLAIAAPGDWDNPIDAFAGDIFKWLESAIDDVKKFIVKVVDGVTHFFIEIGGQVYHFIMRCINHVMHAIQFILNKIKVAFEELVQWIGFIFSWNDIIRTHNVLKNIFTQYSHHCCDSILSYKESLIGVLNSLNEKIDKWADIPTIPGTIAGSSASAPSQPGRDSPRAHWALYHTKGNVAGASTTFDAVFNGDELENIITDLYNALMAEEQDFKNICNALQSDVIDQINTLSASDIVKRLLAILTNLVVNTAANIIGTVMDIVAELVKGVLDALTKPLDIPVVSFIYKQFTGSDLTLLDLVCLIAAIPVTIIYKLITKETPFPDNSFTRSLIEAPDWATIRQLYSESQLAATDSASPVAVITLVLAVCGYFGALGMIILTPIKAENPQSGVVCTIYALCYLPYIAPNIAISKPADQAWYVDTDEAITVVSVIKTFSDISLYKYDKDDPDMGKALTCWAKGSPYVELVINAAWEVPAIGYIVDKQDAGTIVGFLGNTCFNIGGVLSPWSENEYVLIAIEILIGAYGEMMLVQGLVNYVD